MSTHRGAYHSHNLLVRLDAKSLEGDTDGNVYGKRVVLQIHATLLHDDVASTSTLRCCARDVRLGMEGGVESYHHTTILVLLNEDSVLRELFLHQQHLLCTSNDEVTSRVVQTFLRMASRAATYLHLRELGGRLVAKDTTTGLQHDGKLTDRNALLSHQLVPYGVLDVDEDGGAVGETSVATLIGRDSIVHNVGILLITRSIDVDVCVAETELGVHIAADLPVGLEDFLHLDLNEKVERVNLLLYESSRLEQR